MVEKPERQHELLYACYLSGQISEKQWQKHLAEDERLRRWVEKREKPEDKTC